MTEQTVRAMLEADLTQVIAWAQDEQRLRADQRRHDTLAKIKELAGSVGLSVTINGKRGRPSKGKTDLGATKPGK